MRAPLPAKLLVGYLGVLGLVLVPTFLILRSRTQAEVRGALEQELAAQVALVGQRLGESAATALPTRIDDSRDELGEVAAALDELTARLRCCLLQSSADRMTLHALSTNSRSAQSCTTARGSRRS